ncbi:MAG TPA: LytR C-terminal domain-containing protein [Candidatus Fermentibacter daniensis]|nr:MAG: hypothetical protein AO396_06360 [Candidatus Fermentibacter daniensis]MBP7719582.1 LytR C-terminal domain-containing protein [Candidatus Fermentibacter sp.]OQC68542.1 MAG: hypothetical protein BWX47_01798 [candidate division Hyd24-12 bacterium ADurb.Bin004]KZD19392.1 MAG: hypothetical protein AO395_07460 [Candidatus Fermentibacter daniensis]KZD20125.1 MAG: hypothetical protein AO394_08970 [Candidatus Fermentibacter daniensis]
MAFQTHGLFWRTFVTLLALALFGVALWGRIPERPPEESELDSLMQFPDSVSLRILNGSGMSGLARTVQRFFLGASGETVFTTPFEPADADRDNYAATVIVSHIPGRTAAEAAAAMLGLGDSSIVWSIETDPETDLTIYLGRDVASRRDALIPVERQNPEE